MGKKISYPVKKGIVSEETSVKVRAILETVVSIGSGKNAQIDGYEIGGKTATSQTLPRSANRYISSFLGFAPAKTLRYSESALFIILRESITEEQ